MTYGKCEICGVKTVTKDNDFHGKISHKLKLVKICKENIKKRSWAEDNYDDKLRKKIQRTVIKWYLQEVSKMGEGKCLINEWLQEYTTLQDNEIKSFAAEHEHNHEITTAIFNLLYNDDTFSNDPQYEEVLENVCTQLFGFYRSKEAELQRFTLQFVPILVYKYLSTTASGNSKSYRCIETLLIGLYNFEVVDETGKPKVVSFKLPSLAQASIYHEPLSLGPQFLTESSLRRWEECNTKLISWGPFQQVEVINAQNRLKVVTALYFVFNQQLSLLSKLSIRHFCIVSSRIVTQGFDNKHKIPRIPVSSSFLLEIIQGAYFAMYNEFYTLAHKAIKDIDQRAQYELFPNVILVTSAVLNALENSLSGQPCDGPMGISVALSPAATTVAMSKSVITNASFRTKKLPDDIPIQAGQVVTTESNDMLTAITEEGEAEPVVPSVQREAPIRSSRPKLGVFPVLGKKTKDAKDKNATTSEKKVTVKETPKGIWPLSSGGGDMVYGNSGPMDSSLNTRDSVIDITVNSDSRSQITTESQDNDTTPRFTAMQVSSV